MSQHGSSAEPAKKSSTLRKNTGVSKEGVDDARALLQLERLAVLDGQQAAHVDGKVLLVRQRTQQRQEEPLARRHPHRLR